MLEVHKTEDGFINSYLECYLVNKDGQFDNYGDYIFVYDCWVHPSVERKSLIHSFIQRIHVSRRKVHTAKWIYWKRHKYGGKISLYKIERNDGIIKLVKV